MALKPRPRDRACARSLEGVGHTGAVAFSCTGDPATRDFSDATVNDQRVLNALIAHWSPLTRWEGAQTLLGFAIVSKVEIRAICALENGEFDKRGLWPRC
jgi:hypothetical protein